MAKEKSKKKSDAKPSKSKITNDFAKPSDAPASGEGWKFESMDNVGKLFLITPLREQDFESADYGTSKIIVADVVEINEKKPEKSEEHTEVFVFGGWTKGTLRGYIGNARVLCRLARDKSKSRGKSKDAAAWVLEDADADDKKVATAYIESLDPFGKGGVSTKPSKGDGKADKKKGGKKKKK